MHSVIVQSGRSEYLTTCGEFNQYCGCLGNSGRLRTADRLHLVGTLWQADNIN